MDKEWLSIRVHISDAHRLHRAFARMYVEGGVKTGYVPRMLKAIADAGRASMEQTTEDDAIFAALLAYNAPIEATQIERMRRAISVYEEWCEGGGLRSRNTVEFRNHVHHALSAFARKVLENNGDWHHSNGAALIDAILWDADN